MIAEDTGKLSIFQRAVREYVERVREVIQHNVDISPYLAAAQACGFTFKPLRVTELCGVTTLHGKVPGACKAIRIELPFQCLCGKREAWVDVRALHEWGHICVDYDPVRHIHEFGSFGEQHLLDDGYLPDEARRIADVYSRTLRENGVWIPPRWA